MNRAVSGFGGKVALVALLWACSAEMRAGDFFVYCSSTNSQAGDGSLANPYQSLSSLPWTTVFNQVIAGNPVRIRLQRGSVFRSQLTFGASGTPTAHIILEPYDSPVSTNNPVIAADDVVSGFAPYVGGQGSTWQSTPLASTTYAFLDGARLNQGSSPSALKDREWVYSGGKLHLRLDEGNPDLLGRLVEASVRTTTLQLSGGSYVDINGIDMRRATTRGCYLPFTSAVSMTGCRFSQGGILLNLSNSVDVTVKTCVFEDGYDSNNGIRIDGPETSFSFDFCLFHNFLAPVVSVMNGVGQGTFVNCTFVGSKTYHIYNSSTNALLSCVNCIFSGVNTAYLSGGRETIRSDAGQFSISNCLVMACGKNPSLRLTGVAEYNSVFGEPGYRSTRFPGIIAFGRDDSEVIDDVLALSILLKTYGWGVTYAFTSGGANAVVIDQAVTNKLRAIIANGSQVTSHARDHVDLTEGRGFALQYTGAATSATVSIENNWLTTRIDGAVDKTFDLSYYKTLEKAFNALNKGNYRCTWPMRAARIPYTVPCWLLTNVYDHDILSAPFTNGVDYAAFLDYEIRYSKAELESITGAPITGMTYPYGGLNGTVLTNTQQAGYQHGRTVTFEPTPGYLLASNDVYQLAVAPDLSGTIASIGFENSGNDASTAANSFTANNVVYSSTNKYRGQYSARFDGFSSHFSRLSNASFDFSWGDWLFCVRVFPAPRIQDQTLYFAGNSAGDFVRILLGPQGVLRVSAQTNGVSVVDFSTPVGAITNSGWQKISVQENYDRWFIRINDALLAVTNSASRLKNFGGTVYLGCGYDFSTAARDGYFEGWMDDLKMGNKTCFYTQSTLDQICEEGCFVEMYGHTENTSPQETWRVMFDAVRDYSGRVMVMTEGEAANYIRTNGTVSGVDGRTVLRTNALPPAQDYRLRDSSVARGKGTFEPLVGKADLFDLTGERITDSNGSPVLGVLDLGAYQYEPVANNTSLTGLAMTNGRVVFAFRSVVGVRYRVQATTNLTNPVWVTLQTVTGDGSLITITDSNPNPGSRYYRTVEY